MKRVYKLRDLECANCAAKMEAAVAKLDGVEAVTRPRRAFPRLPF